MEDTWLGGWPGAVIVYFAAQPKLQLQYCGIVDAPLPGLAKRVQSAVDSWTKFGNVADCINETRFSSSEMDLRLPAPFSWPFQGLVVLQCGSSQLQVH